MIDNESSTKTFRTKNTHINRRWYQIAPPFIQQKKDTVTIRQFFFSLFLVAWQIVATFHPKAASDFVIKTSRFYLYAVAHT